MLAIQTAGHAHNVCSVRSCDCRPAHARSLLLSRYGNLGDGNNTDRHMPTAVRGLDGVKVLLVACGWRHTLAADEEGRLFSWGWSKYGQLGHGDFV